MTGTCIHGFPPDGCLICRTLGAGDTRTTQAVTAPGERPPYQCRRQADRPDVVYTHPPVTARHRRSLAGSLVLVLAALLAVGAAAWILAAVVFTALHLLELIAVGAGCGWVGYKIGHFRGARHPRA